LRIKNKVEILKTGGAGKRNNRGPTVPKVEDKCQLKTFSPICNEVNRH